MNTFANERGANEIAPKHAKVLCCIKFPWDSGRQRATQEMMMMIMMTMTHFLSSYRPVDGHDAFGGFMRNQGRCIPKVWSSGASEGIKLCCILLISVWRKAFTRCIGGVLFWLSEVKLFLIAGWTTQIRALRQIKDSPYFPVKCYGLHNASVDVMYFMLLDVDYD